MQEKLTVCSKFAAIDNFNPGTLDDVIYDIISFGGKDSSNGSSHVMSSNQYFKRI